VVKTAQHRKWLRKEADLRVARGNGDTQKRSYHWTGQKKASVSSSSGTSVNTAAGGLGGGAAVKKSPNRIVLSVHRMRESGSREEEKRKKLGGEFIFHRQVRWGKGSDIYEHIEPTQG